MKPDSYFCIVDLQDRLKDHMILAATTPDKSIRIRLNQEAAELQQQIRHLQTQAAYLFIEV